MPGRVSRVKIDISGMPELMAAAEKLKKNIFAVLGPAVLAGSDIIRDAAKQNVHSISGELVDGIVSEITWDHKTTKAFAGAGMAAAKNDIFVKYTKAGKRYYYPASVEYGQKKGALVAAHPFMRPAMLENRSKVRNVVKARVKAVIDGVKPS